jgi:hypothetical protein
VALRASAWARRLSTVPSVFVWSPSFLLGLTNKIHTSIPSLLLRDATPFELWASLFASDCALLFNARDNLITDFNQIFAHLRKFCLQMHICRGATASKTEAMYFPPPRRAYAAADTSRFLVDGTGFLEFSESFKYLGSIINYTFTSDADVCKRIKLAT